MASGGGRRRRGGANKNSTACRRRSRHRTSSSDQSQQQPPHHYHHQSQPQKHPELLSQLIPLLSSAASAARSFLSGNDLLLLPSQTLTLESLLSSTSLSLSSLLLPHLKPHAISHPLPSHPSCWFHRFLSAVPNDDDRWVDAFRMSNQSFTLLLRILSPSLQQSLPSIPPNYALAAAIFRLAHGASYNAVGRWFGLDESVACRAFFVVCKAVHDKLGSIFEFRSDMGRIVVGFGWMSLPNCCGVLGFGRFPAEGELLGKDGALMVQALVDSEGRFLDVSAGWPSTMKPETILRQTNLFSGIVESRELLNGQCYELKDGISLPQYILGDSCFPLFPWLLTPFRRSNGRNSLSYSEREFNSVHSRGMGLVSTAFGRLRALWRLLTTRWKGECLEFFPFVVVTCCLLHNFLNKCSEPLPDENVACVREQKLPVFEGESSESAQQIRNALASHLSRVSCRR